MSTSSIRIGNFSIGMWQDLGQPTDLAVTTISGWVTQPQTLGRLNNFIGTCYQATGYTGVCSYNYDVVPALTEQEFGILDKMYRVGHYQQLIKKCAGGGQKMVQSLSEGDSKISYVSAAALAKVYVEAEIQANKELNYQVNVYNQNSAGSTAPRSVDFYTIGTPGFDRGASMGAF